MLLTLVESEVVDFFLPVSLDITPPVLKPSPSLIKRAEKRAERARRRAAREAAHASWLSGDRRTPLEEWLALQSSDDESDPNDDARPDPDSHVHKQRVRYP